MHFYGSYGLNCDFLEFPLVNSFKFFTQHQTRWGTNFLACAGTFFKFCKLVFPEKRAPIKVNC